MNFDFEPPPTKFSWLASVGGVVTAVIAISGLNFWSQQLTKTATKSVMTSIKTAPQTESIASLDAKSVVLPGQSVSPDVMANKIAYVAPGVGSLTPAEKAIASSAWSYFQSNWNNGTGLVNSADKFSSVTMWDQAEKEAQGKSGFVPVATRWVVERSNSWMERCKSLVKNAEMDSRPCEGKTQVLLYQANAQAISYSLKRY